MEAERKMTRIVVGFLRNFFSKQSTARAVVLRRVPRIAIVEQMTPPIFKWLSGIIPSCERNAVELSTEAVRSQVVLLQRQ